MVKQPIFLIYTALVLVVMVVLILYTAPRYGSTHILVYTTICSLAGSLTVQVRDPRDPRYLFTNWYTCRHGKETYKT